MLPRSRWPLHVLLRTLSPILCTVVAAASLACGPGGEVERESRAAPERAAGGEAEARAELWLDDVRVGHEVDPEGAVPAARQADEFAPGESVYVSMEVAGAPPFTAVHVIFRNGAGETVAEDEKKVPAEARYLYFESGDTSEWQPGSYRVVVAVDGEPAVERELTLTGHPVELKAEPG